MTETSNPKESDLIFAWIDLGNLFSIREAETETILAANENAFNRVCAIGRVEDLEGVDLSHLY